MANLRPVCLCLLLWSVGAGATFAHGLEVAIQLAPPAVVVKASYGGTEAVPFAAVRVIPPGGTDAGPAAKTDRRGYFSFVPDRHGAWRIVIDDEMGHRVEKSVEVPARFDESSPATSAGPPRVERAITGIALILGLTGMLYGRRARRSGKGA